MIDQSKLMLMVAGAVLGFIIVKKTGKLRMWLRGLWAWWVTLLPASSSASVT